MAHRGLERVLGVGIDATGHREMRRKSWPNHLWIQLEAFGTYETGAPKNKALSSCCRNGLGTAGTPLAITNGPVNHEHRTRRFESFQEPDDEASPFPLFFESLPQPIRGTPLQLAGESRRIAL